MAEFLPLREIYSSDEEDDEEILLTDDVDGAGKAFEKYYNKFMDKFGSRKRAKARRKKKAESQEEDQQTKPEVDEHEYDFYNPRRGKAIIINNDTFHFASGLKDRKGSKYDATGLKQIFTQLGFDVTLHNNLTTRQMVKTLTEVASNRTYDNNKADCFACAILSHGGEEVFKPMKDQSGSMIRHDVVFGVDGTLVPTRFLLSIFNDECCPELEGKPRLFFIQACRGGKMDDGTEVAVLRKKKQKGSTTKRRVEDQPDARAYVSESDEDTSEETSPEDKDQNTDDSSFVEKQGKVERDTKEEPKEEQEGRKQGEVLDCDKKGQTQEELQNLEKKQTEFENRNSTAVAEPVLTICPSPIYKDFLLMYAAPPGYFAWRRENGGWLMQTLINVLRTADVTSVPLTKLLTTVCRRVAMEYQSASKETYNRKKKLVPCVMSMLTKDVYFRSKAK